MQNVKIEPIKLGSENRIKLQFRYDRELINKVKQIPERIWSSTMKCWHVPDDKYTKDMLVQLGLCNKKQIWQLTNIYSQNLISDELNPYFKKFESYLKYKRYSSNTIRVYLSMMKVFFSSNANRLPEDITSSDIIKFNNEYILKNNFSFNYQNQLISAIKLFFEKIENKRFKIEEIERPKCHKSLPVILSKKEIASLLKAITNLKHKAVISLIYSAGLRIGESINMKLVDIDSQRGLIHIRKAKGQKDRMANLSPQLLRILRAYVQKYKPNEYLFNGQQSLRYTASSIRKVLQKAKDKAGIKKDIKIHTLRHSFATHMLEKGVDIRYIQDILGHNDPKTTMIYTHVSEKKISIFVNPLDDLDLDELDFNE